MYLAKAPKGAELIVEEECCGDTYTTWNDEAIKNLFELGKYVDWRPEKSENLFGENHDNELYIVDREFLLYLIEEYRKKNYEYFSGLLEGLDDLAEKVIKGENVEDQKGIVNLSRTIQDLQSKAHEDFFCEWGEKNCLQLNDSVDGQITTSWRYEYSIFNLVHILHTFDWENNDLVYIGY